jgi:DNA-directed RNA polymerase subunit RPC12/RpoP
MQQRHNEDRERTCQCPYCEYEIEDSCFPFCGGCGVTIYICPDCNKPFNKEKGACPTCGASVEK